MSSPPHRNRSEPPRQPLFDEARRRLRPAPGDPGIATPAERDRIRAFEAALPELLRRVKGGRAQRFYPYLLVRSAIGDRGGRPILERGIWRSPDIWIYPGDPSTTPPIPPEQLDMRALAGASAPFTVYAHVWNVGLAPILGVHVEFYTQPFRLGPGAPPPEFLGIAMADLGGRSSPKSCHALVKCPAPWNTLGSIIVRVSCFADAPASPGVWDPATDRHVTRLDNVVPI